MKFALNPFANLDFSNWAYGLVSAFVGGGASAVSAGIGVQVLDPKDWSMGALKFYELVGTVFLISGVLNMMAYLSHAPLPAIKTTTTTTTIAGGTPPQVVTVSKEVKTEVGAIVKPAEGGDPK